MTVMTGTIDVDALRASVRGTVFASEDHGYDAARSVWNAMIDRRPRVIVRAAGVADVIAAVSFARDHDLVFSGAAVAAHNVTGSAVADGGLMLDMSWRMNSIRVQPERRTVRAEAGCLWQDLDHETQTFGLAVTGGQASDTGIAGLTLGGGVGQLMRYCGATVDNLLSVDLVTATGRLLTLSADEHPELFWAVRRAVAATSASHPRSSTGLHAVGPIILGGMLFYSSPARRRRCCGSTATGSPTSLPTSSTPPIALLTAAASEPFIPEWLQHQPAVAVQVCYVGDIDEGQRCVAPLRTAFCSPAVDLVGPIPYTVHQQLNDPGTPWGRQVFLKSANIKEMSDDVIDILVDHVAHTTSPLTLVPINAWGGAISRVPNDATAFGHRDSKFTVYIFTMWADPDERDRHIHWARAFHEALRPHMNGIYVNEMGPDERVHEAYSSTTYARLVDVKNTYDPTNFFRMNQNIVPTV